MSDDSDMQSKTGKRRKRPVNAVSSSESSESGCPSATSKRSRKLLDFSSNSEDTDSEIDTEFIRNLRTKKNLKQVLSSNEEDSSSRNEEGEGDLIQPVRRQGPPKILSDYESEDSIDEDEGILSDSSSRSSSDNEDTSDRQATGKTNLDAQGSESSSDYDGQAEKCPICLARFNKQEIGSPESCDHCFCAVCIQEWAKNVNTCPVDRQPFTLILVRQHLEGHVIRQVPVNPPTEHQEDPLEDATFCEVCGQSDREDRMLLCDSCDHGYHMDCLLPPLLVVPIEEWYCPECAPIHNTRRPGGVRGRRRRQVGSEEDEEYGDRQRPQPRLLPRTRQSERVRTSLRNRDGGANLQASMSSGVESMEPENNQVQHRQPRQRRRRPRTRRQPKTRIKRIVTDDGVIEVLVKCKKRRKYKKKRKSRTLKATPRTVKGRLASRLGMCQPRMNKQTIPETFNRQEISNSGINHQRHQAGVPTLDIFGRRNQLDYFSGSDGEEEDVGDGGTTGVLSRVRVARPSDRLISHKKAASILSSTTVRTPLKVEDIAAPASGNLLDSILDSQKLWHSKKTEIKSNSDGSLQVILPKSSKGSFKESNKVDVKTATGPVKETPIFPGGRTNSGGYRPENSSVGAGNQGSRSTSERTFEESGFQSMGSGSAGGYQRYESNVGPSGSPLRGMAPIRFRMNVPPRRPNIHSYPSDNIPPPPPLRLRSQLVEMSFPATNSPEGSPTREEEEIDIYSDIEQENPVTENEDKTFGALEPPPEPPFLMTMEPPPEPPAILMNINDDASDDEPSGLVIDDPPAGDVYDPCAANSDDSSTNDAPLAKPPEVPRALKDPELVADYSSDSADTTSYNPELPTYSSTPIFGPLPRPPSHHSSEANDDDEECPNFSMYSAASMNLAHRGLSGPLVDLDIPIPPPIEENINIPLPDEDSPNTSDKEEIIDIPVPQDENIDATKEDEKMSDDAESHCEEGRDSVEKIEEKSEKEEVVELEKHEKKSSVQGDTEEEGGDDEDEEGDDEGGEVDDDRNENVSDGESSLPGDAEKVAKVKIVKTKTSSEAGEDECSTQGDVLDLAIESEANLENNTPHEDVEEQQEMVLAKSPVVQDDENDEKMGDGGDKSDGLVDITDEEMSVYDGQDNGDDLEKLDESVLESDGKEKHFDKSLYSDDDNSLVGGATSAVSGGTLNNSDNIHPPTLPGLEGLETETISESEDVNFDELPLEEGNTPPLKSVVSEDDQHSTRKKKKKKYRKASHCEENSGKGNGEQLEFEEGEIIEDKPKQVPKKDKKVKAKPDIAGILDENVDSIQAVTPAVEKDVSEKKTKKKKEKASAVKDKNDKNKEPKEKTLKPGHADENISWKKLSKSNKERNYRDGKEKDEKEKDRENKDEGLSRKEKRNKEKRKELERYDVRRLISEKPKRPKKDEFGRDISPSKSGSSLSPYRSRFRSPLRTRNRSRTKSRSRSRSRGRRRRSRSREKVRSRDRSKRSRSRDKGRSRSRKRSRSRNKVRSRSREKRRTPDRVDKGDKGRTGNRSLSRTRRKTRSPSVHSRRHRSISYSRSWTPSWSKSSSRSRTPKGRRRTRSVSHSKSGSWTREQNVPLSRSARTKEPHKNLTVIVTNKDALKKKDKKKPNKKKDDRRKKKRGQSPAPSKEVFTSGDNILVSVNFKNANKNPELIPATTPLLRESSKRKRDDMESSAKKKKLNSSSKKTPGAKKSSRLAKINEATRNAKPVAIIDLDLSPFREQTPSPKEIIVLTDSENEGEKQRSERQDDMDRMGHNGLNQSMLSLSSNDHGQKNSMSQPESPISSSFMLNSSGPKTPPEPHIKFSISTKPSQVRMLSNPLMEQEEEMQDENIENEGSEILHKGPNTPPEPPPDLNTPASPPTTPYDPFDPTKSRSPSPQPRSNDTSSQINTSREDKLDSMQTEDGDHAHMAELRTSTPPNESEDLRKTPEPIKVHSTPKTDPNNTDASPKVSPQPGTVEQNKLSEDTSLKPVQKLLTGANKLDVTVHKSPEKLITVVISQQVKNLNQTPKQAIQPLKPLTPIKHQTPKSATKHQLFSSSLVKQVPILGTLPLLSGAPLYNPSVVMNSGNKTVGRVQNGDQNDDMDIDPSSPYSPGSSEGDDLFEPPIATPPRNQTSKSMSKPKSSGNKFDALFGSSPAKLRHGRHLPKSAKKIAKPKSKGNKKEEVKVKLDEDQLKILDELPSSAVEMQFLKKLNRQERVVEEVKLVLKPHYAKKHVNKEEYKEILRRSVPKICHNKSGEINPMKIQFLVEAYVKKFRYAKKKASGALPAPTQNKPKPQKALWS